MYDETIAPTSHANNSLNESFKITSVGSNLYNLKICGSFKPGWLARLSNGLSESQINIRSGRGERVHGLHWDAEFDLFTSISASVLRTIDFCALLERDLQNGDIDSLELSDFRIQPDHSDRGSVWVDVQGPDKLGFLQNILKSFALYSLFPCKLEVKTSANLAQDRFRLKGIAGLAPSASALEGLEHTFMQQLS